MSDVISMGGTLARLSEQGHDIYMAYETSGNIAVFDHDVVRYLDFIRESAGLFDFSDEKAKELFTDIKTALAKSIPEKADPMIVRKIKTISVAEGSFCLPTILGFRRVMSTSLHCLSMRRAV